MNKKSTI